MIRLSEIVGIRGGYDTLHHMETSVPTQYSRKQLISLMTDFGVEEPESSVSDLVAANLLHRDGDLFDLSTLGIRTSLLLEAINGSDLNDVYRRLSNIDTSLRMYELIREEMTIAFLQNLYDRPGFGRLYFCSPWINLDSRREALLTNAIAHVENRRGVRPEILIITRPEKGSERTPPKTLQPFKDLGAAVYLNKRLHTKLYIREPDTSGGFAMAIVGSQNLTKSKYLELGIRINADGQMIDRLIGYFLELTFYSIET